MCHALNSNESGSRPSQGHGDEATGLRCLSSPTPHHRQTDAAENCTQLRLSSKGKVERASPAHPLLGLPGGLKPSSFLWTSLPTASTEPGNTGTLALKQRGHWLSLVGRVTWVCVRAHLSVALSWPLPLRGSPQSFLLGWRSSGWTRVLLPQVMECCSGKVQTEKVMLGS